MALLTSANPDLRLREAIDHIRSRYGEDRRWVLELSLSRTSLVSGEWRRRKALSLGNTPRDASAQIVG
jgi:hypothetical protein